MHAVKSTVRTLIGFPLMQETMRKNQMVKPLLHRRCSFGQAYCMHACDSIKQDWTANGFNSATHVLIHWQPSTPISFTQKIVVGCMKSLESSISYPRFTFPDTPHLTKKRGFIYICATSTIWQHQKTLMWKFVMDGGSKSCACKFVLEIARMKGDPELQTVVDAWNKPLPAWFNLNVD